MFWRRMRYSSRSSGPWNLSRNTSSASGGMYRSLGQLFSVLPSTRARALTCSAGIPGAASPERVFSSMPIFRRYA